MTSRQSRTVPPSPPDPVPEPALAAASYEQARDELAEVVAALEAGGLSLDESLRLWERGEALARTCTTFLEGARARVEAALAAAEVDDARHDQDS
jgi:exodeoxyribonuclease VII small subunit